VHFIRNMHGHCKKGQRNMVSAALREVFNAEDLADARERSASVIERLSPVAPKVAELLTEAEEDLLAFYRFPAAHWPTRSSSSGRC
jgi:putative transposase